MNFLFHPPFADPATLSKVEWVMRCLVLHSNANEVNVDLDGKHVKGIRFGFPSGNDRYLDYAKHPARPHLIISRGGA